MATSPKTVHKCWERRDAAGWRAYCACLWKSGPFLSLAMSVDAAHEHESLSESQRVTVLSVYFGRAGSPRYLRKWASKAAGSTSVELVAVRVVRKVDPEAGRFERLLQTIFPSHDVEVWVRSDDLTHLERFQAAFEQEERFLRLPSE